MKKYLKLICLLACVPLIFILNSCGKESGTGGETEESAAVKETREFFENYYNELNKKNFSAVSDYYSEQSEQLQSKIDMFKFMATMFDVSYELKSVEATYLDDGGISASIITVITSKDLSSGAVTVMEEPSSYAISKTDGKLIITSYAVGESEVVSIETAETAS